MATITDLNNKRSELNAEIATYVQAIQDFNAGSITQTQLDTARATCQAKGDEYAKLAAQVKSDNPSEPEANFYSNPAVMTADVRSDVAKIMLTGNLIGPAVDYFNELVLNTELWESQIVGNGTGLSFFDSGTGGVLRLKSNTRYTRINGNYARLLSVDSYPVGTSFKVRIRRVGGNSEHVYLGMINEELGTHAKYFSKNGHSYAGNFLDESGNTGQSPRFSYDEGPTAFTDMELRWVDESTLEWYKDGVLVHTTTGADFHSNHRFYVESGADSYANWIDQYLDVDSVVITPP